MRMRWSNRFQILLVLLLMVQTGCLSRRRTIPANERMLPAQTVSRADLYLNLQKRSAEINTLNARVTLDISSGSNKTGDAIMEYRQTTGFLLVERPGRIRVRAQAPL